MVTRTLRKTGSKFLDWLEKQEAEIGPRWTTLLVFDIFVGPWALLLAVLTNTVLK